MATNTKLTKELAARLLRQETVTCPNCAKAALSPRYRQKLQNVEFKCSACGEIYRPCKMI